MSVKLLHEYHLGDMLARYTMDTDSGQAGFLLLPAGMPLGDSSDKNARTELPVQLKLTGDTYDEAYAMGNTMRNSETVRCLEYGSQKEETKGDVHQIDTVYQDTRGNRVIHHLRWKEQASYVKISCTYENRGKEECTLEMFESFSLGGLSPYLAGDGHECMYLHRIRSVWSGEGRHEEIPIEDLQLEPAWDPHAVRCERFGQAGSMPVNKFFPFAAVEDRENHVFWGAQIAHNASWQMELYRKDDGLSFSGGLADREFGHWMKKIRPGENFQTPYAVVSVAQTDSFDVFTGRLTQAAMEEEENLPQTEQELPIIFNEYCTTWGNPSHENILNILEHIRGKGFRYFVIDCGWYKEEGVPWDIGMGDYEVSEALFPEGLEHTVQAIKEAGMVPGLWFEIENVGSAAKAYHMEEHLLHKDGRVLTSYFRRFWNMADEWVEEYLTEKVIGTLKKYGFGYMKMDYNETVGIGCDGAESLGEGLRRNMEASLHFIRKVKKEIPGIVLENCASGGHRLEPGLMSETSMASFSDAHECVEIPIIAANLHRVISPRQSQIWAVIRTADSLKRIAYSVINTFLGRMCISGDATELSKEQWDVLDNGMAFYKKLVPIIKEGQSYRYGTEIKSYRHPKGWQAVVRMGKGQAYVVVHVFSAELPVTVEITLPEGCPCRVQAVYSDWGIIYPAACNGSPGSARVEAVSVEGREFKYCTEEEFKAIAVLLA